MRQAQHEAWKQGKPNAHEIGRKEYTDSVETLAEELATQMSVDRRLREDSHKARTLNLWGNR
jgi:hypothetical protein